MAATKCIDLIAVLAAPITSQEPQSFHPAVSAVPLNMASNSKLQKWISLHCSPVPPLSRFGIAPFRLNRASITTGSSGSLTLPGELNPCWTAAAMPANHECPQSEKQTMAATVGP